MSGRVLRMCPCGSEWFRLTEQDRVTPGPVTVGDDGSITSYYAGVFLCAKCGRTLTETMPTGNRLSVVEDRKS